jgi:mRNA-degrading endonuclease toxin of MazEF toxin-antitoxin module
MPAPPEKLPRFDMWWVELPYQEGHAQSGRRPAVLVADEPTNRFCIVAPLTTNLDRLRFKGTLRVEPDHDNGLPQASVVMAFQIRYLDRDRLAERIGRLSVDDQAEFDGVLAELLGFDG